MDAYEGPAWLEWWANQHMCLGSMDVRVSIVSDNSGWHSSAAFAMPLTDEDRDAWTFLMRLSPYFTLRFRDDETATIDVHVNGNGDELTLTAT